MNTTMVKLKHRFLMPVLGALALVSAVATPARADEPLRDDGFMKPPRAVQNRKYTLASKHDIALFGMMSVKNQLTEHYGAALTYAYSFNEYWALDVLVAGGYGGVTNLAKRVRETTRLTDRPSHDFTGAGAMLGTTQLGVRFTPAYGKLNLSAELPIHFNAYFSAGVGGALVEYNSILACSTQPTNNNCGAFRTETLPTFAFNASAGLRFFVNQNWSIRAELRNMFYPDRYYDNVNFKDPVQTPGTVKNEGITYNPLVFIGAGFML